VPAGNKFRRFKTDRLVHLAGLSLYPVLARREFGRKPLNPLARWGQRRVHFSDISISIPPR
jgi:hypothetical protein